MGRGLTILAETGMIQVWRMGGSGSPDLSGGGLVHVTQWIRRWRSRKGLNK